MFGFFTTEHCKEIVFVHDEFEFHFDDSQGDSGQICLYNPPTQYPDSKKFDELLEPWNKLKSCYKKVL